VVALFVSVGSVLLAAGPATAISHRAVDGASVIETNPHAEVTPRVGSAAGRITYR
jgi:hypothetical protein